jgi:hypothetical protein
MPYTPSAGQLERFQDIQTALGALGISAVVLAPSDKREEIRFTKGAKEVRLTICSTPIDGGWFDLDEVELKENVCPQQH